MTMYIFQLPKILIICTVLLSLYRYTSGENDESNVITKEQCSKRIVHPRRIPSPERKKRRHISLHLHQIKKGHVDDSDNPNRNLRGRKGKHERGKPTKRKKRALKRKRVAKHPRLLKRRKRRGRRPRRGRSATASQHPAGECAQDQLMTNLARMQVVDPESILNLASESDVDNVCKNLSTSLKHTDEYLNTCKIVKQKELYMKLISGVRALEKHLCLDSSFKTEYIKYAGCYSNLRTQYNSCISPHDWIEDPNPSQVCRTYEKLVSCYHDKTLPACGEIASNIMKKLMNQVVDSVITVDCSKTLEEHSVHKGHEKNIGQKHKPHNKPLKPDHRPREQPSGSNNVSIGTACKKYTSCFAASFFLLMCTKVV